MKILFVITQSEIGGAQRFLLDFAPYLVSRGHEVIVVAGEGDGELFEKFSIFNFSAADGSASDGQFSIKTYHIKNLVRNLNPLKDFLAFLTIVKVLKVERPSILFLQSTKAGFLGSLAAKIYQIRNARYQIRVIYRIGGWAFNDPRPWWMNQVIFWMEKISTKWKDVIIVNSEFDKRLAIEKNIAPAEKIVKIYNGINPDSLNFLSREKAREFLPLPPGGGEIPFIVGTVANLYATKGIEYLIESTRILYQVPNTKYQIPFLVIGDGPERPKLEALIKKYNLQDRFFLLGRIPNATQYLKAFDIFVLPSVKEGFPWVLLEAMAAGVPIIATKVGAVPEIIEDGKDGLLAPPRNSKVLAEKIIQMAKCISSNNSNDRLSCWTVPHFTKSARGRLTLFSLQKMLDETKGSLQI